MLLEVALPQVHERLLEKFSVLPAPLPCKVLHHERVVQNVSGSVKDEFKVNIYLDTFSKEALIDDFVVVSVAKRQVRIFVARETESCELLEAETSNFEKWLIVFAHERGDVVLSTLHV